MLVDTGIVSAYMIIALIVVLVEVGRLGIGSGETRPRVRPTFTPTHQLPNTRQSHLKSATCRDAGRLLL